MMKIIRLFFALCLFALCACDEQDNPIVDIPEDAPEYMKTGLPVLYLDTPNAQKVTSKEVWMEGASLVLVNGKDTLFDGGTSIRGRGNSTWLQAKKPYALKLDKKGSFWGLPKHKRWVLLANAYDRTMVRYDVAFHIAKQTELQWTPSGEFVELVMNGKHQGTYWLGEQIKIDDNRVNVSKENGVLLELDQYYDEVNKFRSIRANLPYMFKEPDELTQEQFNSVHTYINAIEDLLWDDKRLLSQEYLEHLDINSFIDYWFVQELTMNLECNHPRSTYCYFDKGVKLTMGPVWDFDYMTLANTWFDTHFYGEDRNRHRADQFTIRYALYYGRLFLDPYFRNLVQERWKMFRDKFWQVPDYIYDREAYLFKSDLINYPMWPHEMNSMDGNLSFDESIERIVEMYIRKLKFLDERITKVDFSQP